MRQFIRHPADITIEVGVGDASDCPIRHSRNIGLGGLAFQSDREMTAGMIIDLRIPLVRPPFETRARVVWCESTDAGYELGVEFLHPDDAFRARMVEQVCHIEDYRKGVALSEGRELTVEEAAMEWIGKHAADFPAANGEPDGGAGERT